MDINNGIVTRRVRAWEWETEIGAMVVSAAWQCCLSILWVCMSMYHMMKISLFFFAIHWRRWPMVASMWQKWIPCLGRARKRQKKMKRHGISSEQFKLFLLTLWKRTRGHVPFLWSLNLQIVVVFRCSFVVSFFALNTIRWEYHVASYKHYNANTLSQFPVIKWYIFTSTFIQNRMWQNDDIWMCVCAKVCLIYISAAWAFLDPFTSNDIEITTRHFMLMHNATITEKSPCNCDNVSARISSQPIYLSCYKQSSHFFSTDNIRN